MNEEQFSAAVAELEGAPRRVRALAEHLAPAAIVRKPSPDSFSVLENVWHLRDIETEGYLVRIGRLLAETNPTLPDLDGAVLARDRRYNELRLSEGLEGFESARSASVSALRAAGTAALGRAGHLETVGPITLGGLVKKMLEHDRGHLEELTRLRPAGSPALEIVSPDSPDRLAIVRDLFLEYQHSLGVDLCFQGFEKELAALPGDYAPPRGRLVLGLAGGEPACCVGLRPIDERTGEMKRLYVRPAFRGLGFGGRLARLVLSEGAAAGYLRIVLDTLPSMSEAQALYERLGFRDIAPYRFNPVPGVRYMALELAAAADRPAAQSGR